MSLESRASSALNGEAAKRSVRACASFLASLHDCADPALAASRYLDFLTKNPEHAFAPVTYVSAGDEGVPSLNDARLTAFQLHLMGGDGLCPPEISSALWTLDALLDALIDKRQECLAAFRDTFDIETVAGTLDLAVRGSRHRNRARAPRQGEEGKEAPGH